MKELTKNNPTKDYGLPNISSGVPIPPCKTPKNPSEPVSTIKGKVVEGSMERVLELIVGADSGEMIIDTISGDESLEWSDFTDELWKIYLILNTLCLDSEYTQISLDKQIEEAEEELLKAQAKVDELMKRKEGNSV